MRCELHRLVTEIEHRPKNVKYSFMDAPEGYAPDPFNPHNIVGMMDQTLAGDYWFDQFTEPRIVSVMVDLLGPDLDFHNGKIRNKPPGFVCSQSWHQDWPYERHTEPDLAAVITYLDPSAFEAGATEVLPGSHLKGEYPTLENSHTPSPTSTSPPPNASSWKPRRATWRSSTSSSSTALATTIRRALATLLSTSTKPQRPSTSGAILAPLPACLWLVAVSL